MSRNRELCLGSRYIHTGNSGVTISVVRDKRSVDRATLFVESMTMGAFDTRLRIRGNDYAGFTSAQLADLSLVFLNAAYQLELTGDASFESQSPSLVDSEGKRRGEAPKSLIPPPTRGAKSDMVTFPCPIPVLNRIEQLVMEFSREEGRSLLREAASSMADNLSDVMDMDDE